MDIILSGAVLTHHGQNYIRYWPSSDNLEGIENPNLKFKMVKTLILYRIFYSTTKLWAFALWIFTVSQLGGHFNARCVSRNRTYTTRTQFFGATYRGLTAYLDRLFHWFNYSDDFKMDKSRFYNPCYEFYHNYGPYLPWRITCRPSWSLVPKFRKFIQVLAFSWDFCSVIIFWVTFAWTHLIGSLRTLLDRF